MAKEVKDIKSEIAISKLYIKDLEYLIKKAEKPVTKEKEKKKQKLDSLKCEYTNLEEAHEAYGYGVMSQAEFEKLQDFFSDRELAEDEKDAKELYLIFLKSTLKIENRNIEYFEKELFNEKLVEIARS